MDLSHIYLIFTGRSLRPSISVGIALIGLSYLLCNILITAPGSGSKPTVDVPVPVPVSEPVEGSYVNSQFGIEITFPKGWRGSSTLLFNDTVLYVTLSKVSNLPELAASDLSTMALSAGKDQSSLDLLLKANPLYENCRQLKRSNQTIDGKVFSSTLVRCPTIQYKTYQTQTPVMTLNFTYTALPGAFEAPLEDFDNSIRTIKIR